MANARPNILFIMSDEHDPGVTGCYGDPVVRTPNLDRLAANGVLFDGCYCNSPLCVPSRLSFTAGQYVSRIDAWCNNRVIEQADAGWTLPRVLHRAGYTPYLCGKQHYHRDHRYGFVDLLPKHNQHGMTGHHRWRNPDDSEPGLRVWHERAAQFHVGDDNEVMALDREVTATVRRFLGEAQQGEGPWFLFAGYVAPHFPLIVPKANDNYRGRVPMPELPPGLLANLPRNYRHHRLGFGNVDTGETIVRRGRELYWGMVDWFDQEVGKVLGALADSAVADDTIVIYTSDHGENKGDHGLWWKNCMYEHGARVPLLVSWPARWAGGQRRSGACSLVDVVRLVTDLAGGETPAEWDGDSLLPWLDDAGHRWKDTALVEYYGHNITSGFTLWREGTWKYTYHNAAGPGHPAERELYDLASDPKELRNRAAEPAQAERLARMHAAMLAELGEDPEVINARCIATFGGYAAAAAAAAAGR